MLALWWFPPGCAGRGVPREWGRGTNPAPKHRRNQKIIKSHEGGETLNHIVIKYSVPTTA